MNYRLSIFRAVSGEGTINILVFVLILINSCVIKFSIIKYHTLLIYNSSKGFVNECLLR